MQWFVVKYRKPDGTMTEAEFEAADKSALFKLLAEKKISAINIQPGRIDKKSGRKSVAKGASHSSSAGLVRGIVAGSVVIVAAFISWFFLFKGSSEPQKTPTNTKNAPTKNVAESAAPVALSQETNTVQVAATEPERVLIECKTNATSGVIIERWRTPDGKTHRRMINPPPIFSNACDQVIAMVVGSRAGQRIPPLPPMRPGQLDKAFAESLLSPITVGEDDKPEVAALKLAVKAVRGEIAEAIKAGDTRGVAEILQEHVEQVNFNADLRGEAIQQLRTILDEGDQEFANEYLTKVNESLSKYGIEPLKMPSSSTERNH